jgi:tRNA modification GTPase
VFSTSDTIVAIATPPGRGGIGVVRLSGPDAHAIAKRLITHRAELEPRHATLSTVRLPAPEDDQTLRDLRGFVKSRRPVTGAIDQVVATYFPAPASYTGDDVVELSAHGSPVVLRAIVTAAVEHGARLAEPGEFTLRAFLNGRMDLLQAEAVADLIDAATPLQARAAFDQLDGTLTRKIASIEASLFDLIARLEASVDFPDEGYHFVDPGALAQAIDDLLLETATLAAHGKSGRLIREGLQVAIVGAPNVGKSSLFNALVGASRAIVTDTPGTTRDLVTEVVDIHGLRVTLVDTAGLRDTDDRVEAEGVERARQAATVADLTLEVRDGSVEPFTQVSITPQTIENKRLIVNNKSDIGAVITSGAVSVSARTGDGIDALRANILQALDVDLQRDCPAITNIRHIALVERAHKALGRARAAALTEGGSMSEEFVLADLQDARAALEEITGVRAPEDLLEHIFSRFCIGK